MESDPVDYFKPGHIIDCWPVCSFSNKFLAFGFKCQTLVQSVVCSGCWSCHVICQSIQKDLWMGQFCLESSVSKMDNILDMIKHNFPIMGCLGCFHFLLL